ncbi:hypothetical protein BLNAU_10114 [Blattamonas nauphoetae]|uniref:Uncharacterized protein n=1 Tax=Blattamonas nauphoetae TaxID=2049346 RepID=A0ABQ9XU25_9EUKA|nr:hypothetical protein BLNAU_10114 [Blattamonas nauphoetae]
METEKEKPSDTVNSDKADLFSLPRRCGFALIRIQKAVLTLGHSLGTNAADKTRQLQEKVGGMILRNFSSLVQSPSEKEIGAIGFDLAAVRREMETEREHQRQEREKEKREMEMREKEREIAAKKKEEERQREFSRKMRELEEMKKMNEKWIEEGRQREEERRKKDEEDERRRNVKKGATAIEVFQGNQFTLAGNSFTTTEKGNFHLLSNSFGAVVEEQDGVVLRGIALQYRTTERIHTWDQHARQEKLDNEWCWRQMDED